MSIVIVTFIPFVELTMKFAVADPGSRCHRMLTCPQVFLIRVKAVISKFIFAKY